MVIKSTSSRIYIFKLFLEGNDLGGWNIQNEIFRTKTLIHG